MLGYILIGYQNIVVSRFCCITLTNSGCISAYSSVTLESVSFVFSFSALVIVVLTAVCLDLSFPQYIFLKTLPDRLYCKRVFLNGRNSDCSQPCATMIGNCWIAFYWVLTRPFFSCFLYGD